jgi:hypothetical protein
MVVGVMGRGGRGEGRQTSRSLRSHPDKKATGLSVFPCERVRGKGWGEGHEEKREKKIDEGKKEEVRRRWRRERKKRGKGRKYGWINKQMDEQKKGRKQEREKKEGRTEETSIKLVTPNGISWGGTLFCFQEDL